MNNLNLLSESDIEEIFLAFKEIGWNKPKSIFEKYLIDQKNNQRDIFIAKENNVFCGYVTIKWKSDYANFQRENIPEICDLNVLPKYQRHGIGSKLIIACEDKVNNQGYSSIGLGVGLIADYGNAQRLYVRLGYIPDGRGLFYKNKEVLYGKTVVADDDLVIYFSKNFKLKK